MCQTLFSNIVIFTELTMHKNVLGAYNLNFQHFKDTWVNITGPVSHFGKKIISKYKYNVRLVKFELELFVYRDTYSYNKSFSSKQLPF